jgi:hypothetical protein
MEEAKLEWISLVKKIFPLIKHLDYSLSCLIFRITMNKLLAVMHPAACIHKATIQGLSLSRVVIYKQLLAPLFNPIDVQMFNTISIIYDMRGATGPVHPEPLSKR